MSNKDESAAAPRRSSRISALPSAAVKEIKAKVEKVTKKRPAADGEGAKEKAPKKVCTMFSRVNNSTGNI